MIFSTFALLALTASVIAHPRSANHRHRLKPSGNGKIVVPTGGMYGAGNNTSAYGPTGTGLSPGTAAVPTGSAPGSSVDACVLGSQSTTTIYSTDLITMTVTAEDAVTAKIPAGPNVTVAAVGAEETPDSTSASPLQTTDSSATSSDVSYPVGNVNAPGEFYQAPDSQSAPSPTAPPVISSPSTGSYGSGKRGLAYNSAALTSAFAGKAIAWAYNWGASPAGSLDSGYEYVPMLWGEKMYGGWHAAAKSAIAAGAQHLLSFNEPDLGAQANMDSATAAAAHIEHMNPYAGQAKIGSPAVTNGGPDGGTDGMGLTWMQNFFDKCAGNCKVDFLAFHWYDSATNVAYFKKHVKEVIDLAKKNGVGKVWLTEFGASGSDQEVAKFLAEVLPWMDSNDAVERYAYFMCGDGHLISGSSISDPVGKAYVA